jgi:hypothetical protein
VDTKGVLLGILAAAAPQAIAGLFGIFRPRSEKDEVEALSRERDLVFQFTRVITIIRDEDDIVKIREVAEDAWEQIKE